eukprot:TRINITY_DN17631_c0_g2_i4.p1 TRINITY_DN17631_c0_g2~~TRINITY_DN17631_c0_g2_i4.p1  ORF type:complete len:357 (+),score=83.74 TRINITY_DN17631_c0_g2_i4:79-1149(+)
MSLDKGATALSVALLKCFGEDGDCRIVVRAPSEGDEQTPKEGEPASKSIKGEFRVWSKLLCAWSDVFNAMFTHDFKEASEGTVVIVDFSVSAVAAFLRFMYCGNLHCDDEHLLEVAALADKYAVTQLQEDCEKRLGSALTVQSACEMLRAADRMGTPTLKAKTFDFVCQHGKEALKNGYVLGMSLLNEVLDAKALCLDDFTLATTMLEWLQAPAAQPCNIDVESLCRRHVHFAALDDTQYGKIKTLASTVDMEELVFVSCSALTLAVNDELTWMTPNHAIVVSSVKFKKSNASHVEVWCSANGSEWQWLAESKEDVPADASDVPCRSKGPVKWIKLRVRKGSCSTYFQVAGTVLSE